MVRKSKQPRINYNRGRAKEYRTMDKLRRAGFEIVFRSAGSHSAVDVIGISKEHKKIKLIQNKPKSMSGKARDRIVDENSWLNDEFMVTFEVV